jgi:acyl-CoA synthetase (AMP-forming)/AMP-acid ligase II
MSVPALLEPLSEGTAGRAADVAVRSWRGHAIRFGELADQLRAVTGGLVRAGMRPGDRALYALRPSPGAVVLQVAVLRAGGVLVATDLGLGETVFEGRITLLAPRFVLTEPLLLALTRTEAVRRLLRRRGTPLPPLAAIPAARFITVGPWVPGAPSSLTLGALRRAPAHAWLPAPRHPDDETFIVFTSGTTEAPKAVVHTQASLEAIVRLVGQHLEAGAGDVLMARDLHLVVPALLAGATVVLPPHGPLHPERVLALLEAARVTHAFGVPHDWQRLADHCRRTRRRLPATLRLLMLGAAPVHRPFLERLREVLAPTTRVLCVYGMTEIAPVAVATLEEKLAHSGPGDLVGTLLPGVAARASADGELLLRGPNLFRGYLGGPAVEEHATGDMAVLTDEGRVALLGRRKDMIIRGHHNLYPELYEPALEAIPGVRRCAIVGVYDEAIADERVVIAVEPEPGLDPVAFERRFRREIAEGTHRIDLAARPDAVLVGPLPVGGRSDKVDKRALRALASRRLCLSP